MNLRRYTYPPTRAQLIKRAAPKVNAGYPERVTWAEWTAFVDSFNDAMAQLVDAMPKVCEAITEFGRQMTAAMDAARAAEAA